MLNFEREAKKLRDMLDTAIKNVEAEKSGLMQGSFYERKEEFKSVVNYFMKSNFQKEEIEDDTTLLIIKRLVE